MATIQTSPWSPGCSNAGVLESAVWIGRERDNQLGSMTREMGIDSL